MSSLFSPDHAVLLDQEPAVIPIQQELLGIHGFVPAKRQGKLVLWEMEVWPEVNIWLDGSQADLSIQYIIMQCYKAGKLNGQEFQINEHRMLIGMPPLTPEDQERLASFRHVWTQVGHLQRTPQDFQGS